MQHIKDWNHYFYEMVDLVAAKSKDASVKVGAIITNEWNHVVCTGYNGFPRGIVDTPERWESPEKYNWVVHAEHNAILQAAMLGIRLQGLTMYTQWLPCNECAKSIIQAGIKNVYYFYSEDHFLQIRKGKPTDKWNKAWERTQQMFIESNVPYARIQLPSEVLKMEGQ